MRGVCYDGDVSGALIIALAELVVVSAVTAFFLWYFSSEVRSIIAGAPFAPMPDHMVPALLDMTRLTDGDTLFDLGCGDGRILRRALERGVKRVVGYEVAWWPFFLARRRLGGWGDRAVLVKRNALTADLSEASVIYLYLGSAVVEKLASKFERELRSGVRILCPLFPIDTARHPSIRLIETRRVGTINAYLYEKH